VTIVNKERFLAFLKATVDLTPTQREILLAYDALSSDSPKGVVEMTGLDIAKLLGLRDTVFSRLRRQLVAAGYLEESPQHRLGNIRYYRPSEKIAGDDSNVIPLRRTAT
jgi:DNA-binding MarR family transcriptional regulator